MFASTSSCSPRSGAWLRPSNVAVPAVRTVMGLGIAHEKHGGGRCIRCLHDLAAHSGSIVVQAELYRICCSSIHHRGNYYARLFGLVVDADQLVPLQLTSPDLVLALNELLIACPEGLQAIGRDNLAIFQPSTKR